MKLLNFQNNFARRPDLIHLNNAGLAPISLAAKNTIDYWAKRFYEEGFYTDADYMKAVAGTRQSIASLVGCSSSEISFFTSAAGGINQFAFSCGLEKGDEVLMWDQEYSSHLYPWKAACDLFGANLKLISSENNFSTPTEKYLESLTDKTKVVAFSWVQFQTGAMMDAAQVIRTCKQRGIKVFIDAMQGLGVLPFNLWDLGIDALVGGSHKWLVSPVGVGFMAIRKENALKMKPHNIGAYTYGTCDDPSSFECEPKRDATRYEPGSKQVLEITALGSSIDLILDTGVEVLQNESLRLAKLLSTELESLGFQYVSSNPTRYQHPICNFLLPQQLKIETLTEALTANKMNFAKRGPGIRFSPYAFNTDNEIQKLRQLVETLI